MSDNRRTKRYLLNRAKKGKLRKGETEKSYIDNKGMEYQYAWVAKMSSLNNIICGCLKNGFPIVVPRLWYTAWAFYPFFFVRKDLRVKDPIPTLNHERIHVRQQRDLHIVFSIPLIILSGFAEGFGLFNPFYLLCIIPFIPTLIYGVEMLRSFWNLRGKGTFNEVRENTCFERESISRATNADYLLNRKFMAVLAYTGWKKFQNYGI